MREIKFRAKRKSGEWVVGSLFVEDGMGITYILSGVDTHYETNYLQVEVVPKTVGQFTGLKDADGREIYEDDIVRVVHYGEESIHVIKYCDDMDYPAFDLWPHFDCECNGLSFCICEREATITVIGNAHDNPELLEVRKP